MMSNVTHPWWSTRAFAYALILVAALPLLWPPIPPLVDLPGHMGRYAIQLADPASPLHKWYEFNWGVIGNLGIDLLVMPLGKIFGLELAVKLIVMLIPPLTVAGMLLVAREAHGDVPPSALFALPLAYGYPFQFGFVNFALSISLALLGFALWLRWGRLKRFRLRTWFFVPYGIGLWFVHSFGWGVLGLVAFASDAVRRHGRGKPWLQSAWEAGWATAPLMPPLFLMLVWRSGHVSGITGDWFNWTAKKFYLVSILRSDGTGFDWWSSVCLLTMAGLGILGIGFRRNRTLLLAGAILALAYLCLPRIVLGSAYADMRLAPYMVAVLLLALAPKLKDHRLNGLVALAGLAFFLVRMGSEARTFARVERGFEAQLAALDHVPRGSRVLALTGLRCLGTPYWTRMDHLEAFAIIRREAFVNGQWTMAGAQLLRVNYPDAPRYSKDPSQVVRPAHCRQRGSHVYPAVLAEFPRGAFDYLWLIDFRPERWPLRDPGLEMVWHGKTGALFRIDPSRPLPAGIDPERDLLPVVPTEVMKTPTSG